MLKDELSIHTSHLVLGRRNQGDYGGLGIQYG